MTIGHTVWLSLHQALASSFAAVAEAENPAHRLAASTAFDVFKWNLRLLEAQKLVSPGWSAMIAGDLGEAGRMIGGMLRKTRAF